MAIKEQIQQDLKEAMRAKDRNKVETLRLITAAIKQIEVDERKEIDNDRALVILDKLAKQRKESISQFKAAKRDDLVDQETYELAIIQHYLPTPLSQEEIMQLVHDAINQVGATSMKEMGNVMALLRPKLQGRADMSEVSALIKAKLG